jgi:uncharacterized coiled-coil DUF342 family protein
VVGSVIDTDHVLREDIPMNKDERAAISRELCELFDLANELRRRIDELAETIAYPAAPERPRVVQLTRRPTRTTEYDQVIAELREMGHVPPASSADSQGNET